MKTKLRAELEKSHSLIVTTDLISPASRNPRVAAILAQAWPFAPWAGRLPGKHNGALQWLSVLHTESTSRLTQSCAASKGSTELSQPNSECHVGDLLSLTRLLNKNYYFQGNQEPACTVLPRAAMTKAGLFITICSSN